MHTYFTMEMDVNSFDHKFKLLQSYIKGTYSVEAYSEMFSTLKENHEKVSMAYSLFSEAKLLPDCMKIHPKSSKESVSFREKGNKEFLQKKDLVAIQTYSVSAAFAPINSEELALAFGNRSAVTFSLKEYGSCIEDIDRALSGKYPNHIRYKLYERKGKCLKFVGKQKSAKDCFQQALNNLSNSHLDNDKLKAMSAALNTHLNSCSDKDICDKTESKCLPCLSGARNDVVLSASSLIKIKYSQDFGRHLIATSDIEPGDVLVIEKPFSSILLPSAYNNFCFHCKKRCHALLPCLYCVVAMYCSAGCQVASWDESHRYECSLLPLLVALDFTKIEFIALRTLLVTTQQYKSLQELVNAIPDLESITDPESKGLDKSGKYNSADYRAVHHLAGNAELRPNADVFRRAATAAFILHLLDVHTDYFSSNDHRDNLNGYFETIQQQLSVKFVIGGLLLRYLMIVSSNAHEVSEMLMTRSVAGGEGELSCHSVEVGGALYPVLSLINHSCDPNVVRHSHTGDLNVLTAIQVIKAGQQIYDNYGYHHAMHDVATRRSKLWGQYHFSCGCVACQEEWPVYAQLPSDNPVYAMPSLKEEVEKSSEIFAEVLGQVKAGQMEGKLPFLLAHLRLLHHALRRPWHQYSECQEAIKQCLSYAANHYLVPSTTC